MTHEGSYHRAMCDPFEYLLVIHARTSCFMGGLGTTVFKRLASLIAAQHDQPYSSVMAWIRCSISFSLLRSAVTCLHGAQSHRGSPVFIGALDLALSEGQVLPSH